MMPTGRELLSKHKLADLKGQHYFILFYVFLYLADPATFMASNSVLGPPSSEKRLFIQLQKQKYSFIIVQYYPKL